MNNEIDIPEEPAELQDSDFTEDDFNETPPSDIVAYNELRSCADLQRMYDESILEIKPEFQRDFVWKPADQTRFVDSLIKQLPIPSMCFALDYKTDKWMVIDGLQRISTIIRFLSGSDWRLSKLDDIDEQLRGKSAAAIKNSKTKLRNLFTRVQNQSLPINVLRCDFSKKAHMEYLFTIFHRLNSGGTKLNNQEIRNCIYGGPLNDLLRKLDSNPDWRKINKMRDKENYRFVKQEIILRFLAFYDRREMYTGQIAKFLNEYMFDYRSPEEEFLEEKTEMFGRVVGVIAQNIFPDGPDTRVPTSIMEALLVSSARNIENLETKPGPELRKLYRALRQHEQFREEAVAEGLSKKDKVTARFAAANEIFAG